MLGNISCTCKPEVSYYDEQQRLADFLEEQLDDLISQSPGKKLRLLRDMIEEKRIEIDDIIEFYEEEILKRFSEDFR